MDTTEQNDLSGHAARLRVVPAFAECSDAQIALIASIAEEARVPQDHQLVRDGRSGRDAFVIIDGQASIVVDGRAVALIGPGSLVGEISLLSREHPRAMVRTTTPVTAIVIDPRRLAAILGTAALFDERVTRPDREGTR